MRDIFISKIYFDKICIIGPTGDQYEGVECYKDKTSIEFIKNFKNLPSPDHLLKDLRTLMIFDDVKEKKKPIFNEDFVEVDIINVKWYILIQIYSH